jgi:hypothetical protein
MTWLGVVGSREDESSGATVFEVCQVGLDPETQLDAQVSVTRRYSDFNHLCEVLCSVERHALGWDGGAICALPFPGKAWIHSADLILERQLKLGHWLGAVLEEVEHAKEPPSLYRAYREPLARFALDEIRGMQQKEKVVAPSAAAAGTPAQPSSAWLHIVSGARAIFIDMATGEQALALPPGGQVHEQLQWRPWMDGWSFESEWALGPEMGHVPGWGQPRLPPPSVEKLAHAPALPVDAEPSRDAVSPVVRRHQECGFTIPRPRQQACSEAFMCEALREFTAAIEAFEELADWDTKSGGVRVCKRTAPFDGISVIGEAQIAAPPVVVWSLLRDVSRRKLWDTNVCTHYPLACAVPPVQCPLCAVQMPVNVTPGAGPADRKRGDP